MDKCFRPAKLSTRLNKLYGSGRLQQAVGEDRAQASLRTAEETKQRLVDVASAAQKQAAVAEARAEQSKAAVKLNRTAARSLAAGASVPGVALLKYLLFDWGRNGETLGMSIAVPKPLSYGKNKAVFGPELREYISQTADQSFLILDENGNVLHTFQITDELRTMMA